MEVNPHLYEPKEPTAAAMREKFVELLAVLPAPAEMSYQELTQCAEMMAQISIDVMEAYELLDGEIKAREVMIDEGRCDG